ncbi:MAG: STAS domain-containing protein [Planctomycetota bacterium]|nr:STAS domain-containing protein [Planctomycetota bacterium]
MAKESSTILVERVGAVDIVRFGIPRVTELRDVTAMEAKIEMLAKLADKPKVLVDFGTVDFISSAVLGVLAAEHERLLQRGGSLGVCGLNKYLTEVVRVVGLNRLLTIHPTAADALKAMN